MCINLCLVNWYALFNVFLLVVFLTLGVQSHERKKKNKQTKAGTREIHRHYQNVSCLWKKGSISLQVLQKAALCWINFWKCVLWERFSSLKYASQWGLVVVARREDDLLEPASAFCFSYRRERRGHHLWACPWLGKCLTCASLPRMCSLSLYLTSSV